MNVDDLQCFPSAFIRIHWGHPLNSRWKDYEMRKGFTRKPQGDEPATRGKNCITRSGLERLKDEHRFLLTRERPAVTEVVAWAASNGDRSENAEFGVEHPRRKKSGQSPVLETLRNDRVAFLRFRRAECDVDGFAQTRRARSASPVERGPRRRTLRGAGRLPTLRSSRTRGRTIFLVGRSLCRPARSSLR